MSRPATGLARAGESGTHSRDGRGGPVQNIGAYGVELASVCAYVEAFNWQSGEVERIAAADCRFGYRDSIFKHDYQDSHFIIAVGLRLPKAWRPVAGYGPLAALGMPFATGHFRHRLCHPHGQAAGSGGAGQRGQFLQNPVVPAALAETLKQQYPQMPCYPAAEGQAKLAAGWLIDQCGLKGVCHRSCRRPSGAGAGAGQSGGASAMELIALAAHVRDSVEHQFGVVLEHEVRFMGRSGETWLDEVLA